MLKLKRTLTSIILINMIMLTTASPVMADYTAWHAANSVGDNAANFYAWQPLAEQGDAEAQYALGSLYNLGRGTSTHYIKAAYWFKRAAKQGHVLSQSTLGVAYVSGKGVYKNLLLGYMWINVASAASSKLWGRNTESLRTSNQELKELLESGLTNKQITTGQQLAWEFVAVKE